MRSSRLNRRYAGRPAHATMTNAGQKKPPKSVAAQMARQIRLG
jgi:hypothetical protein